MDKIQVTTGGTVIITDWVRDPETEEEKWQLEELLATLMLVNIRGGDDKWVWDLESNGEFTVSSLRKRLEQQNNPGPGMGFEWSNWVPQKVNFLVWRIYMGRAATMVGLRRRNVQLDSYLCKICGEVDETEDHLFVGCQFALAIWDIVAEWIRCPSFFAFTVKDVIGFHNQIWGTRNWRKLVQSIIMVTLWGIWRARNDRVFNDKEPRVEEVKNEIRQLSFLWFKHRAKRPSVTWDNWCNMELSCMNL
ncbi:putative reverse transcriptase zinc-binding domain-containing protein [Helianthus debilis subsp. tardiflorus]